MTIRRIGRDRTYEVNDPGNEPVTWIDPGEIFSVSTELATGPWLTGPTVTWDPSMTTSNNPCVCVAVTGARPGDILDVEIVDVQIDTVGYMALPTAEAALPQLAADIFGDYLSVTVTIHDGTIDIGGLEIPVRPLIGTLGTTLAEPGHTHLPGGPWGGNMDVQEVTTGATVSLPVFVPGALLNIGDVHARQSDLEFSAVETRGVVTLRVGIRRSDYLLTGPRIVDSTHISTVGFADATVDAFDVAAKSLHRWLVDDYAMSRERAYFLMGAAMQSRCTRRIAGMNRSYICKLERSLLGTGGL